MAKVSVALPCSQGGRSILTLNFTAIRSGGDNDRAALRLVRRRTGYSDVVIPGSPEFVFTNNQDARSWTWVDNDIPATDGYLYVVQVKRINGGGSFQTITLTGLHITR